MTKEELKELAKRVSQQEGLSEDVVLLISTLLARYEQTLSSLGEALNMLSTSHTNLLDALERYERKKMRQEEVVRWLEAQGQKMDELELQPLDHPYREAAKRVREI